MTPLALHDHHPAHRHLRLLGADLVFTHAGRRRRWPARAATRWPATRTPSGCWPTGELVGVFPEGFKGIGKPFSERYKLQRFGRGGFVVGGAAHRGADHPVLDRRGRGDLPDDRQRQDAGPAARAAVLPDHADLPAARPARRGPAAVEVDHRVRRADRDRPTSAPAAAEDPMLVFNLTDQVRETIQHDALQAAAAAPVGLPLTRIRARACPSASRRRARAGRAARRAGGPGRRTSTRGPRRRAS